MVYLAQPFAEVARTAIIGRQQFDKRAVDYRFIKKVADVALAYLKIDHRVEQKMTVM